MGKIKNNIIKIYTLNHILDSDIIISYKLHY